jgi:hypothetical protein
METGLYDIQVRIRNIDLLSIFLEARIIFYTDQIERNGCLELKNGSKFQFYSITKESNMKWPWMNGMIYFLPMDTFNKVSDGIVSFDEWISREPVLPKARIEVSIDDFYYHDKVSLHNSDEPLIKTWLLYKLRLNYGKSSVKT